MTEARTILAFDCTGGACSVALLRDGGVAARRSERMTQGHAERLLPMLQEVLAEAATGFAALEAISVAVGPGRFTGLRIGIAGARGLALATGRPAIGIGSFAAVAAAARRERADHPVFAIIDSGRAELFAQAFDRAGEPDGAPLVATPAALIARMGAEPVLLAGDGAALVADALKEGRSAARAELVAAGPIDPALVGELAAAELRRLRPGETPAPPRPIYLRPPDARLPERR